MKTILLREILEELRTHHRYIRDRDAKLDALDEQQRNEDAERRANNAALMQESLAAQKRGLEIAQAGWGGGSGQ
jgi:hypothetical protein